MGMTVNCEECSEAYSTLEHLEDLRDNDGICLVCNAPIEVADWDRVLASFADDDLDDIDDIDEFESPDGFDSPEDGENGWNPLSKEEEEKEEEKEKEKEKE